MIEIGNALVSEDVLEKEFVCNLGACHGACCIEGDAGAPLEKNEVDLLKEIYPIVREYMRPEGIAAVEEQGTSVVDWDGEKVTPLVKGKECAYVIFEGKVAKCAIEKAWEEKRIPFKKPISCHLYPIRITRYTTFEAVNYNKWDICSPACDLGHELKVPVYRFLKDSLIRKYGEQWYSELEEVAKAWEQGHRP
ncbi:MAG: DUF3109 family protein [Bacteroidota bacterium]|nr:DUF3109 family protein [Bacteroidota bacterium]MDX5427903.1 DUF3109 family protein [Bacteroidota bacterium]MDX5505762.1 DUF3109 family protein [Bacteroidota bacterium]